MFWFEKTSNTCNSWRLWRKSYWKCRTSSRVSESKQETWPECCIFKIDYKLIKSCLIVKNKYSIVYTLEWALWNCSFRSYVYGMYCNRLQFRWTFRKHNSWRNWLSFTSRSITLVRLDKWNNGERYSNWSSREKTSHRDVLIKCVCW